MTAPGFAGQKRIVDINGSGGAFVPILATTTSTRVVIDESQVTSAGVANVPQGVIDYQIPNDGTPNGFTTAFRATQGPEGVLGAATLPIVLGNPLDGGKRGDIIGQVGQPIAGAGGFVSTATVLIKLRSGSATATSVVVTEYN